MSIIIEGKHQLSHLNIPSRVAWTTHASGASFTEAKLVSGKFQLPESCPVDLAGVPAAVEWDMAAAEAGPRCVSEKESADFAELVEGNVASTFLG